jgi:hypothetical protein
MKYLSRNGFQFSIAAIVLQHKGLFFRQLHIPLARSESSTGVRCCLYVNCVTCGFLCKLEVRRLVLSFCIRFVACLIQTFQVTMLLVCARTVRVLVFLINPLQGATTLYPATITVLLLIPTIRVKYFFVDEKITFYSFTYNDIYSLHIT